MLISLVAIGNSKGIRIPKAVLEQVKATEALDLQVKDNEIVLKPVNNVSRQGWAEAFKAMHDNQDDSVLDGELLEEGDLQWEW